MTFSSETVVFDGKGDRVVACLRNRKLSNISVGRKYQLTDKEVNIMSEIRRGDNLDG